MTLVILAGGLGSRFHGMKVLEPVYEGKPIMELSMEDAVAAGFSHIICLIREENEPLFRATLPEKIGDVLIAYHYQEQPFENRKKPLGTAHALWCLKEVIHEPFCVINADDYYGQEAFVKMAQFLSQNQDLKQYAMVCYELGNTMSPVGSVNRGISELENGFLKTIVETFGLTYQDHKIVDEKQQEYTADTKVSMGFYGFMPSLFTYLEQEYPEFLKTMTETNEFLLPDVLEKNLKQGNLSVKALYSSEKWVGITYQEDVPRVKQELCEIRAKKV